MTLYAPTVIRASATSPYPACNRRSAASIFRVEIMAMGYDLKTLKTSVGAIVGSGVHAAAAGMLTEKATSGELPPADLTDDMGITEIRKRAEENGVIYDRETGTFNEAEQQVRRMSAVYRSHVAPHVNPVLVETRLEADIMPGLVLSGQADILAREPDKLRDTKTGKSMGYHKPQIGCYSLLVRTFKYPIASAVVDFVQRVTLARPQPLPIAYAYSLSDCEATAMNVIRRIELDIRTFREGDPKRHLLPGDPAAFMANPSCHLCSAKYCAAFDSKFCAEGGTVHQSSTEE